MATRGECAFSTEGPLTFAQPERAYRSQPPRAVFYGSLHSPSDDLLDYRNSPPWRFHAAFPLTRQLGKVLEKKYLEDGTGGTNAQEVAELRRAVQALTGDVERLSERQDFTERLLEGPRPED